MKMNAIQFNINNKQASFKQNEVKNSYLKVNGAVNTDDKIKPLPPQGHLIHDNAGNSVKYFFKDIGYDFKSLRNGINGTANDHQLGRLNDVGLVTAGILIATYLASKTTNPKARIMEYVGLGAFLTAMSIYPKLAINGPAKIKHGFDIDKEYIDDQGRKKSVMQDANYVPYDMYLGEVPEEDLSKIGDKMGIPNDIKNRNDVIKEQMRKISTQNNTLWMLTAGVTPALSALLCCGLENYVVAPAIEKASLAKYNKTIADISKKTAEMTTDIEALKSNSLSKKVESLLSNYKGKELPKEEFENLLKIFSENLFENTNEGIKTDLTKILKTGSDGKNAFLLNQSAIEEMINEGKNCISKRNKNSLEKILIPTKEEIEAVIKKIVSEEANLSEGILANTDDINKIRVELTKLIDSKIQSTNNIPKEFLNSQKSSIVENMAKTIKKNPSSKLTEESFKQIVDFAKVMGDFKDNKQILQKCKEFNIEYANGTIIANSYNKFERTLLDVLDIKFSDLKKMRESEEYTKTILDKKLTELSKDDARFSKAMEKLGGVISDMEVKLHGKNEASSNMLDLINSIENNYNNTAKRLSKIGKFDNTIDRLVKEDVKTLANRVTSKEELFNMLDGVRGNKVKPDNTLEYILESTKGVGSSKNLEISRIVERYQGSKNSLQRILHTLDVYKRAANPETFATTLYGKDKKYVDAIINKSKETLLHASAADHTMKLGTINNPNFYKDLIYSTWADEAGSALSVKQKGFVSEATKNALGKNNTLQNGNVLDRFQTYIGKFRNLITNSTIDFTKPNHILNSNIRKEFAMDDKTRMVAFNLIGQTPVDMARGAASRKFATQKWARIIGGITGGVFGIALLAQSCFGKLNNPHNLQKQVNNDTNN